jgi:hypothetical protein
MSSEPVMPFGKFKGEPLTALDDGYLDWLGAQELREPLKGRVAAEAQRRASRAGTGEAAVALLPEDLQGGQPVHLDLRCPACGRRIVVRGEASGT